MSISDGARRWRRVGSAIAGVGIVAVAAAGVAFSAGHGPGVRRSATAAPGPQLTPPVLAGAAMAYDPADHRDIVVGVASQTPEGAARLETWSWDGSRWSPASARGAPVIGIGTSIAPQLGYDPQTRTMVLVVQPPPAPSRPRPL